MTLLFITPAQCRMARAMLNWTQPELAERCGLNTQTVSNFERDGARPEIRTLQKICSVFEMAGVRFLEDGGVSPQKSILTLLQGEDANARLLDDIYHSMKDTGGEVIIAGLSEPPLEDKDTRAFLHWHLDRLKSANITERVLIEEGDTNLVAPDDWYKWLPKGHVTDTPFQVYGDKVALIDWGPPQEIVVIHHAKFANTFKALFDVVWKLASKPVEKTKK